MIPEIDGKQAILLLRKNQVFSNVPVILLSANTNIATIRTTCGADDYLRKPFDLYDLEAVFNKYLT